MDNLFGQSELDKTCVFFLELPYLRQGQVLHPHLDDGAYLCHKLSPTMERELHRDIQKLDAESIALYRIYLKS